MQPSCNGRPPPGHAFCGGHHLTTARGKPFGSKGIGRPWLLGWTGAASVVLRSHSRPNQVGLSKRDRMMQRPRADFASPTGRSRTDEDAEELFFMLTPTDETMHSVPGRGEHLARERRQLKECTDPRDLLRRFQKALKEGMVDASVVGAALQRCGEGLWWTELLEVQELSERNGIDWNCILQSIFLTALASCLKCKSISQTDLFFRRAKALQLAHAVWGHPLPSELLQFNCALSSALNVCAQVGTKVAFSWADELWTWSQSQPFERNIVTYERRMCLCEMQGKHAEVDDMLETCFNEDLGLNTVVLGALMNCIAARLDPRRADEIWSRFLHRYQVKANHIAYNAYAKVHLLFGQPQSAVSIIDEMMKGNNPMNYKIAIGYTQALLIVCHSSLSSSNMASLKEFLPKGSAIVAPNSPTSRRGTPRKVQWKSLEDLCHKFISSPHSLRFQTLLSTPIARKSLMRTWENETHQAGANYLNAESQESLAESKTRKRSPNNFAFTANTEAI